jgi:zinc and cadmium transporter
MSFVLFLDCALIVSVSLLGGIVPLSVVQNHTRLQVYLSFSAGSMLGAAFFHMLPEAVRMGSGNTVRWAALGLLTLFFLERFFKFHQHEAQEPPADRIHDSSHDNTEDSLQHSSREVTGSPQIPPEDSHDHEPDPIEALSWWTAAFGLAVHSLVGGVALASAISADFAERNSIGATGLGVFLATLVHKPADALTIVTLMLRSGAPRWLAHVVNFAFALMIPVGVVVFVLGVGQFSPLGAPNATAVALSFSAGTFLCIALSDLLPELQFHSHDRLKLSLALLAGFCLMALASLVEIL